LEFCSCDELPGIALEKWESEAAVKSVKAVMKKSRKAKRAPYLARLEYSNTPSQGIDSSWYDS